MRNNSEDKRKKKKKEIAKQNGNYTSGTGGSAHFVTLLTNVSVLNYDGDHGYLLNISMLTSSL